MRIEAYNKINSVYQTTKINKTKKTSAKGTYDQIEISQQGKDYQVARKAVAATSDVRMDRVNQIKAQMASGTYNVKMEDVADKLVDAYFDQMI